MYTVLTVIHVLACVIMIGVVLLQQGKGADMGAVFGGSSQTLFGSSGAGNFLTRTTAGVAAVFFVTSLALAYGSASRVTTTIFDDAPLSDSAPVPGGEPVPEGAPAAEPAPEGAPAPEPQADAAPAAEGAGVAAVEGGNPMDVQVEVEPKGAAEEVGDAAQAAAGEVKVEAQQAGEAIEGAAQDAAANAEAAGEAVKQEAQAAEVKAEEAAEAAVGAEVQEAPGQVDPVPPEAP